MRYTKTDRLRANFLLGILLSLVYVPSGFSLQVVNQQLEIYGKLHVSANRNDNGQQSGIGISSNASRIGFKGQHAASAELKVLWQLEQTILLDETSGQFATRNSYLGLGTDYGRFLLGHNDTPYKIVAGHWGLFSDLVPDRLALLGASMLDNVKMNDRGENALLYIGNFGALEVQAMYSASNPTQQTNDKTDDNSAAMRSYALMYRTQNSYIGIGFEDWQGMSLTNIQNANTERAALTGFRIAGYHWFNQLQLGFVYEDIQVEDSLRFPHWDKKVYGLSLLYRFDKKLELALHGLRAEDYINSTDTGADLLGIGLFYKPDKATSLYLAWAQTLNQANASYKVADGGHGDSIKPYQAGADPMVLSAGIIFSF